VEAFSGRFPDCEKGKCKRKLSDYLMRGGLYIEIGFEYKKIFRQTKKKKKARPCEDLKDLICSYYNFTHARLLGFFLTIFLLQVFGRRNRLHRLTPRFVFSMIILGGQQ